MSFMVWPVIAGLMLLIVALVFGPDDKEEREEHEKWVREN